MKIKKRYLTVAVAILLLLVLATSVALANLLIRADKKNPSTAIDITDKNDGTGSGTNNGSGENDVTGGNDGTGSGGGSDAEQTKPAETTVPPRPEISVYDDNSDKGGSAKVELFRAVYDNESGEVTVKSSNGDKLIAPGTSNVYDFYIKNTGNVGIYYTVSVISELTVKAGQETLTVPLEAKFVRDDGKYLFGTENSYGKMSELNGQLDRAGLSVNHFRKYSLLWQWPFEGDDNLDTLLGNLTCEGDGIWVTVTIVINASDDPNATGGSSQTSDGAAIPFYTAVIITSVFLIFVLLLKKRRDEEEEENA